MSHPTLPTDIVKTTDVLYYRFHGVPRLYHSPYAFEKLQQVANEISELKTVRQTYLYFNNTAEGAAIDNARQLQEYVQQLLMRESQLA